MPTREYNLLSSINSPADLRKFSEEDLIEISQQLRDFIIDQVSENPGHLGASLGVVELTVALHYVYNTPIDKIIWDVGHQAYGHKILTGRRDLFHTNRKHGGLSGFPKMEESEYDAFGVGHSSTSISAALGIACANHIHQNLKNHVVAVIGDGALTGGLAYEGLNNAGIQKTNLLVILNDNNMAIDPNVGAMKEYLTDITTSKTYNRFKNDVWNILGKVEKIAPSARSYVQKLEHAVKSVILKQSNLFESIGFRYFGPVDGHDVVYLSKILNDLKDIEGPKLLHILTKKGKGYKFAEQNQTKFHAPGKFDRETGEILVVNSKKPAPPRYQDVFGETILELAQENDKLVGITPAMPTGSSLNIMMKQIPSRTYDVGIAEQHAVTFAAGMATQGLKPYCTIYSTFLQRAYDQIVHDVALQKLPVVFCIDRAGLVGADGPTHHGVFDISFLRHIPNIIISAPMNEAQMRDLMFTASLYSGGPFAIRYPRGKGVMSEWKNKMKEIPVGTGRQLSNGDDIAILSIGHPGNFVARAIKKLASDGINISHYDMRFVKPLDEQLLHKICKKYKHIVTVEDGTIIGGFGSAVIEFINKAGYHLPVTTLGIPDNFVGQASPEELYKECGIDSESIYRKVRTKIRPYVLFSAG